MNQKLEFKYLVPAALLTELRNNLLPYVDNDQYSNETPANEYSVRSIYFDTNAFSCYYEKIEGLKVRRKYRIRGYNNQSDNSIVFIEIKKKNNNHISKDRAMIRYKNISEFMDSREIEKYLLNSNGDFSKFLKAGKKFLYYYNLLHLRPTVTLVYDREAYHSKFDPTLRITFDKNLRSFLPKAENDLFSEEAVNHSFKDYFILEIKFFESLPIWLTTLLNRYNLQRKALSKYTISVDQISEARSTPCGGLANGAFTPTKKGLS